MIWFFFQFWPFRISFRIILRNICTNHLFLKMLCTPSVLPLCISFSFAPFLSFFRVIICLSDIELFCFHSLSNIISKMEKRIFFIKIAIDSHKNTRTLNDWENRQKRWMIEVVQIRWIIFWTRQQIIIICSSSVELCMVQLLFSSDKNILRRILCFTMKKAKICYLFGLAWIHKNRQQ